MYLIFRNFNLQYSYLNPECIKTDIQKYWKLHKELFKTLLYCLTYSCMLFYLDCKEYLIKNNSKHGAKISLDFLKFQHIIILIRVTISYGSIFFQRIYKNYLSSIIDLKSSIPNVIKALNSDMDHHSFSNWSFLPFTDEKYIKYLGYYMQIILLINTVGFRQYFLFVCFTVIIYFWKFLK